MADLGITATLVDRTAKGAKSVEGRMGRIGKVAGKAALGIAGIGIGAAVAGIALAKGFLNAGDALHKMSIRTGVSVETLSAWKFAAEQSGTSLEVLEKGTARLARLQGEAATGNKTAIDTLAELGLKYEDLAALSPADQFRKVQEAIKGIEDPTLRAAAAQEIFGKSGTELLPLLTDDLADLEQQAKDTGNIMSTETAAAAAKFNDTVNKLKNQVVGLGLKGFSFLLPKLIEFGGWVQREGTPLVKEISRVFRDDWQPVLVKFTPTIRIMADILKKVLVTAIKLVVIYIKSIASTIGDVFGLVKALITGDWAEAWAKAGDIVNNFVDLFRSVIQTLKDLVAGIGDSLKIDLPSIPGGGLLGKVPGFASGGIVTRPTLALVGERGPEAIVPLGRGGGMGGGNVTIIVQGNLVATRREERRLIRAVNRAQQRGLATA